MLTTEYITGLTIDRCVELPQGTRNHIAESILKLVFRLASYNKNSFLSIGAHKAGSSNIKNLKLKKERVCLSHFTKKLQRKQKILCTNG